MSSSKVLLIGCGVVVAAIAVVSLYLSGVMTPAIEYDAQADIAEFRSEMLDDLKRTFGDEDLEGSVDASPWELYVQFHELESQSYQEIWSEVNVNDGEFVDIALPGIHTSIEEYPNKEASYEAGRRTIERMREKGAFELLRQANVSHALVPEFSDVDDFETPFRALRSAVHDYRMSMFYDALDDGDVDEQVEALDDILGYLRTVSWHPSLHVRLLFHGGMKRLLEDLATVVADQRASAELCQHLLQRLSSFEPAPIEHVLRGHSIVCKSDMSALSRGEVSDQTEGFVDEEAYRDFWREMYPPRRFGPRKNLPPRPARFDGLDLIAFVDLLESEWLERSALAPFDRAERKTGLMMKNGWVIYPPELKPSDVPNLYEVNAHDIVLGDDTIDMMRRGLCVALKIELFRHDRGRPPNDLAEVAQVQNEDSFIDPTHGKRFVYRLNESSYTLYAVGPDGIDDGGRFEREVEAGRRRFSMIPNETRDGFDTPIIAPRQANHNK